MIITYHNIFSNYIYSNILSWNIIEKTMDEWEQTVLLNSVLDASFLGMHDGLEDIAFLLTTDTGDAGSSPHVARWFLQWCSMTKYCYIYIYIKLINELRYCSIDYITKIASVMMWELTLDEWEKTVLLNSVLDACFFGDAWWSRGYSISVDYWYRQRRFESPRGQIFF